MADELLAESQVQKLPKKNRGKSAKQLPFKQNPYTTAKYWNSDAFPVKDTCKVTAIDVDAKTITITSHDTGEIFEVTVTGFRDDARWVKTLIYHPRIHQRQGLDTTIDEKTKHDHTFPQILDYIIQVGGEEVPFIKHGMQNEQLVTKVKRICIATGECEICRAEYTFGEDKLGTKYVYHRLLRPQS